MFYSLRMAWGVNRMLIAWMPFLFGIGFIAPLTAQTLDYWRISAPFGLSSLTFGLALGAVWGTYAKFRGRWI